MYRNLRDILDTLDGLVTAPLAWEPLRAEHGLLRERLRELRSREARLDDLLVIALVGGSGVGKSTLLNAIAGDELAATSEMRPCTAVPTVYHPPGARLPFEKWRHVAGSALERLVIVDTPDSDTVVREHRGIAEEALRHCDLVMVCASGEKYLDEATWSLLEPFRHERTMVCVETKSHGKNTVQAHWLARLEERGFEVARYFRVNALRTLDRKLAGRESGPDEFDFPDLEAFLARELDRESIRRIKRSNAYGLLVKTVDTLEERLAAHGPALEQALERIREADDRVRRATVTALRDRFFAEPHLWNHVLGREVAVRAKGFLGTCYRIVEGLRALPARVSAWTPWAGAGPGQSAAAMLQNHESLNGDFTGALEEVASAHGTARSEVGLALARAGFDTERSSGLDAFTARVNATVSAVLRGQARARVTRAAARLTSWPVALLFDLPIVAFAGFAGYNTVRHFFRGVLLTGSFFVHAGSVLAILLAVELALMGMMRRLAAAGVRRSALTAMQAAVLSDAETFPADRAAVGDALGVIARVRELRESIRDTPPA